MPIRQEKEIPIGATTYKVKQLPATVGMRINLQLTKLVAGALEAISNIAEKNQIKKLIENYFGDELTVSAGKLTAALPEPVAAKLADLDGQTYADAAEFGEALKNKLDADELKAHRAEIIKATAVDAIPDLSSLLSATHELGGLIKDVVMVLDEDQIMDLMEKLINGSVIRYTPETEGRSRDWIDDRGQTAFDEHFGGNYNELLELFVFLIIFNFAESYLALKKNKVLTYITPYLAKLDQNQSQNETPN